MSPHRIIGLVTILLVTHLSVASSAAACSTRAAAGAAGADDMAEMPGMTQHAGEPVHQSHHSHHSHHSHQSHQSHQSHPSHDAPVQAPCCQSLGSCTPPFDAGAPRSTSPATRGDAILRGATRIPLSERSAPEPPPPKA